MKPESRKIKKTSDKTQPLKKLKPHFEKITILSYRFRFLNTEQFQILLHHKHKERIRTWLNKLTTDKYLKRYYRKKLDEEPAAFSLGTEGRKYFLDHPEIPDINTTILDRVWREAKYTKTFKNHCLFLTHIYIFLLKFIKGAGLKEENLKFFTNADLQGVRYLLKQKPDAYFVIKQKDGSQKKYFIEVFDWYFNKKKIEIRISKYMKYFENHLWQENFKTPFPETILVLPNYTLRHDLNEFIKKQLEKKRISMLFHLSTWDEIKRLGINRHTLHKVGVE